MAAAVVHYVNGAYHGVDRLRTEWSSISRCQLCYRKAPRAAATPRPVAHDTPAPVASICEKRRGLDDHSRERDRDSEWKSRAHPSPWEGSWLVVAIHDGAHAAREQQARADAELRFASPQNNMAPMTFATPNDRIIAVNDAMCEMVGFTKEELLRADSTPFTFPDDVGITRAPTSDLSRVEMEQERYVSATCEGRPRHRRRGVGSPPVTPRQDPLFRILRARHHRRARARGATFA